MTAMLYNCSSLTSVPLFNTSKVTITSQMFYGCSSLTTVPLFDTSNVTQMNSMFRNCGSLTDIPLLNTSKVNQMNTMFQNCYMVQSGALALYQQASTQATPPYNHTNTFQYCGRDTVTGAAELAQIPSSWGGTAS
jgi:surface protein